tara:strand:+ start:56 stop:979 length:924 start_codon:yes stop_codon:yes gene_type:complete
MKWIEFIMKVPKECVEPVCDLFSKYNFQGVAVEEGPFYGQGVNHRESEFGFVTVRACLPKDQLLREKRVKISIGLALIARLYDLDPVQEAEIDDKTLIANWKDSHTSIRIGRSMIVKPSWRHQLDSDHPVVLQIDPGLAFGTGYHPTTQLCLELIENLCPVEKLLDVGTGSGILSIAAAKLGTSSVVAIDVDPVSVQVAQSNAKDNHVDEQLEVMCSTLEQLSFGKDKFMLVVANLYSNLLEDFVRMFYEALSTRGSLVVSGILLEQSAQVKRIFTSEGWFVKQELSLEDWVALVMVKEGRLCIDSL